MASKTNTQEMDVEKCDNIACCAGEKQHKRKQDDDDSSSILSTSSHDLLETDTETPTKLNPVGNNTSTTSRKAVVSRGAVSSSVESTDVNCNEIPTQQSGKGTKKDPLQWVTDYEATHTDINAIIQKAASTNNGNPLKCTINEDFTTPNLNNKFQGSTNQVEADEYNLKCIRTLKAMPFVLQLLLNGSLTTEDERITDEEKLLNVMLFQNITSFKKNKQYIKYESGTYKTSVYDSSFERDEHNYMVDVGLVAKYIHLLITKFDGDGEKLLKAVSIVGDGLSGYEAYIQKLEKSHLHHHILGRDQNPENFELENHYHNNGRKLDAYYFSLQCHCRTLCDPRRHLLNKKIFNESVLLELYKGLAGTWPGKSERYIRRELAYEWLGHIHRHFSQSKDDSLVVLVSYLESQRDDPKVCYPEMKPVLIVPSEEQGVYCRDRDIRFTFDMFPTDGSPSSVALPSGLWTRMEEDIERLVTPDETELVIEDDDGNIPKEKYECTTTEAREYNNSIVNYIKGFPSLIKMIMEGGLTSQHPDFSDKYKDANALALKKYALNCIKGQQHLTYCRRHGGWEHSVVAYRSVPMLKLFIDQHGGDVNKFVQAMFIKGKNITRAQAYAMKLQASHMIQSIGRDDCNPDHIEFEGKPDNDGRCRCAYFPFKLCLCRTECALIEGRDLNEDSFIRAFRDECLTAPFGNYDTEKVSEIRSLLLDDYRAKFADLDWDLPEWLRHQRSRTDESICFSLHCNNCDEKPFPTYTAALAHSNVCGLAEPKVGDEPVLAEDTRPVFQSLIELNEHKDAIKMKREVEDLIHKWGWGNWKVIESQITTYIHGENWNTGSLNSYWGYNPKIYYLKNYGGWIYGYPKIDKRVYNPDEPEYARVVITTKSGEVLGGFITGADASRACGEDRMAANQAINSMTGRVRKTDFYARRGEEDDPVGLSRLGIELLHCDEYGNAL